MRGPAGRRRAVGSAGSVRSGRGEAAPPHCVRHLAAPAGPRGAAWEREGGEGGRAHGLLGRGREGMSGGHIECGRNGRKACAFPARRECQRLSPSRPLLGPEVGRNGVGQGRAAVAGPGFTTSSLPTRLPCLLRSKGAELMA